MKARAAMLTAALAGLAGTAVAAPDLPEVKQSSHVDTMTIGGDLRIRNEYFDHRDAESATKFFVSGARKQDRNRQRFRLRMKADYKLKNNVTVTAGLASGTGESVSTNQSFSNLGAQKAIWIDQAYVAWAPTYLGDSGTLKFQAGRMANPLWRLYTSDILWDGDFNPEGFSQSASYLVMDTVNVFANAMQMVGHEVSGTTRDPWTLTEQLGVEAPLPFGLRVIAAAAKHTWLNESEVGGFGENPSTQLGNVRSAATFYSIAGLLRSEYDVVELSGQLSGWIPLPVVEMNLPFSIQTTFIKNMAARGPEFSGSTTGNWVKPDGKTFFAKSDQGIQVGAIIGKASAPNTFEVAYFYKRAQWDSTVAHVADSDFGDLGGLGRKGNIAWISYTPNGFVTATIKVFSTRLLEKVYVTTSPTSTPAADRGKLTQPDRINRIQADLSIKF